MDDCLAKLGEFHLWSRFMDEVYVSHLQYSALRIQSFWGWLQIARRFGNSCDIHEDQ